MVLSIVLLDDGYCNACLVLDIRNFGNNMEFPLVRDVSVHNVGPSGSLDSRLTQLTRNS